MGPYGHARQITQRGAAKSGASPNNAPRNRGEGHEPNATSPDRVCCELSSRCIGRQNRTDDEPMQQHFTREETERLLDALTDEPDTLARLYGISLEQGRAGPPKNDPYPPGPAAPDTKHRDDRVRTTRRPPTRPHVPRPPRRDQLTLDHTRAALTIRRPG